MVPHYTTSHQYCERCGEILLIGHECILHRDGYFCNEDCLKEHLYNMSFARKVYLTSEKIYKEIGQ